MKILNEVMKVAITVWIMFLYTDIGYKILRNGHTMTLIQANTLEFWGWFLGFALFMAILAWFKSVAPFLKDALGSLVSLRTGKQETPPPPTKIA